MRGLRRVDGFQKQGSGFKYGLKITPESERGLLGNPDERCAFREVK
jgi:hypothetical protein